MFKKNDNAGKEYNYLMATGVTMIDLKNGIRRHDEYECICGRRKFIQPHSIYKGRTKSCGCMSKRLCAEWTEAQRKKKKELEEAEKMVVMSRDRQVWALKLFAGVAA